MASVIVNFNKESALAFEGKEYMRIEVRDGKVMMRPTKRTKVRSGSPSVMSAIYFKEGSGAMVRLNAAKLDKLVRLGAAGLVPGSRYSLEALPYTWFAFNPLTKENPKKATVSKG